MISNNMKFNIKTFFYCFLAAGLFFPASLFGQKRTVTTKLEGREYVYSIEVYAQPRPIEMGVTKKLKLNKPERALNANFSLMNAGEVAQWKNLWVDYSANHNFNSHDSSFQKAWERVLSVPHFSYFRVEYKDQVIFMTGPEDRQDKYKQMKWAYKKTKDGWKLNRDLMDDALMRYINSPTFDPLSGELSPQWGGIYHFEQSGDSIRDAGEYKNTATNHGATATAGLTGNALAFEPGDYLEVPTSFSLAFMKNQMTVEMDLWVEEVPTAPENANGRGGYLSTVFSKNNPEEKEFINFQLLRMNEETVRFFVNLGTDANRVAVSALEVPLKQWIKVKVTYNGETLRLLIDGVLAAEETKKVQIAGVGQNFFIGKQPGSQPYFFSGKMDELKISYETVNQE
ncbi:MAG: LamG domain-containing protein [Bacteroidia bacterium]